MSLGLRSVLQGATSLRALEGLTEIQDTSVLRQASRVLINRHHNSIGGLGSRIGLPMGDLRPTDQGGFVRPYSGGTIELLDFVNGPQGTERYRAEITFVGYRCHQQSEKESGDGDEPYFIVGVSGKDADDIVTKTFGPVEGFTVKSETNIFLEQSVTTIAVPPFTLSVTAMEHDSGTPDEASAKVKQSLNDAAAKLTLALPLLGLNPAIGTYTQAFLNIFGGTAADVLSAVLGMGDDSIGQGALHFFEYDAAKMEWLTPKARTDPNFDRPFNVPIVLDNGEGGRYTAFFNVLLFKDNFVIVRQEQ